MNRLTILWPLIGALILSCVWILTSCSFNIRPDAKEEAIIALWTSAEKELRQNALTEEERASLSSAIDKAIEVVENGRGETFVEIVALSLNKEKYIETYRLAALMDALFVVEIRDDYRGRIRDVLVSLKRFVDTL